jgi:hypothetical protein
MAKANTAKVGDWIYANYLESQNDYIIGRISEIIKGEGGAVILRPQLSLYKRGVYNVSMEGKAFSEASWSRYIFTKWNIAKKLRSEIKYGMIRASFNFIR